MSSISGVINFMLLHQYTVCFCVAESIEAESMKFANFTCDELVSVDQNCEVLIAHRLLRTFACYGGSVVCRIASISVFEQSVNISVLWCF